MRDIILSLTCAYGIALSAYGAWWYPRDMHHLAIAVEQKNTTVELRHRINTWGNVGTILLANLIAIVSFASIGGNSQTASKKSTE